MTDQLREDIKSLVGVVQDLTVTVERSITNQEHQDKEIFRIDGAQEKTEERVGVLEQAQSANTIRFRILAVLGTAILSALIALFLSVTLPVLENSINNKELTTIIKEINSKLN